MGAKSVPKLIKELKSPDPNVRSNACADLSDLRGEAETSVPSLIEALDDSDWYVRQIAAEALGAIGADMSDRKLVVTALERAFRKPDFTFGDIYYNVRATIAVELQQMKREGEGLHVFIGALKDHDPEVREIAAESLGRMAPEPEKVVTALALSPADLNSLMGPEAEESVEALVRAIDDVPAVADPAVRALVRIAMAQIPSAVPGLIKALGAKGTDVYGAMDDLAEIAEDGLRQIVQQWVPPSAVESYLSFSKLHVVSAMVKALGDKLYPARKRIIRLFEDPDFPFPVTAIGPLVAALVDGDADVRWESVYCLRRALSNGWITAESIIEEPDAIPNLERALQEMAHATERWSSLSLWRRLIIRWTSEGRDTRLQMLSERFARWEAATVLGLIASCSKEAMDILVGLRKDKDRNVRKEAKDALRKMQRT